MTFPRRIGQSLRDLPRDERGDEGVSKMLILLLVTVPIILVLVLFGGKIVDEFQVGLCNLGIIDAPQWFVDDLQEFDPEFSLENRTWTDEECGLYRLKEGETGPGMAAPRPAGSEE